MQILKRMYAKLTSHSLAPTPTRVDDIECGLSLELVADTRAPLERANIALLAFNVSLIITAPIKQKSINHSHEGADVLFFWEGLH